MPCGFLIPCSSITGRQIYFGPVDRAQEYFEELGFERPARTPLADYLSSVADIHARTIRDGYEKRIPRTPEDLQKAYRDSDLWQNTQEEVEEYNEHVRQAKPADEFRAAATSEKNSKFSRKKSNYTLSFPAQVFALAKRQYLIQLGALILALDAFGRADIKQAIRSVWVHDTCRLFFRLS